MLKNQVLRKFVPVFLGLTAISAVLIYLQHRIGVERIQTAVAQAGPWGPVLFILLIVLGHIFAPFQGSPVFMVGLALFGKWVIIYSYLASLISSVTNFWIARRVGRELMLKLVTAGGMAKIDHLATHQGIKALIFMRVFQSWITDFVSYAAGLTPIKFSTYYLISVLGPLLPTLILFSAFDGIDHLSLEMIFLFFLVLGGISFVLPPLYYYLKRRTQDHPHHTP